MLSNEYIAHLRSVRRYSPRTCEIYRGVLDGFARFCEAADDAQLLESLKPACLRSYEVFLMDQCGQSARTVNLHLSVLSGFCRFLMRTGWLEANPVRSVSRPKTPRRSPVFFREEAMKEYFSRTQTYVDDDDLGLPERYEKRLARLIVSVLYSTGIRRAELIGLTRGSFDPARRILHVRGKGDKMREIPLVDSICAEILLYLQSVDKMVDCSSAADAPLLVTLKGAKLYPVYVDRVIKSELGDVPGITGRKSPHVLRHTLATELLNEGADLNAIKELLGHESLAATQVYTHNSIERLKRIYNQAHPRAKSGGNHGDQD